MTTLKTGLVCGCEIFNSQVTDDQERTINSIVSNHFGINEHEIEWFYVTIMGCECDDGFPYLLLPNDTMVILESTGHPEAGYEIELEVFLPDHPSRSDCRWPYHHGYHAYTCGFYDCGDESDFINAEEIAAYQLGKQEALTAPAYA
jgi:hypothetical protein